MLYVNPLEQKPYSRLDSGIQSLTNEPQAFEEFERLFLYQLLQEMRKGVPSDGLFGHSPQQKLFEEMLDDHYAGEMMKSGQLGIARMMEEQESQRLDMLRSRPVAPVDKLPLMSHAPQVLHDSQANTKMEKLKPVGDI